MDHRQQHELEHLSLATAAAVVYHQITQGTPVVTSGQELSAILDRVAHALSNVATIYYLSSATPGARYPLAPIELIGARFRRGATVLETHDGTEYRGLTIQRRDMRAAVSVFRSAGIRFDDPRQP